MSRSRSEARLADFLTARPFTRAEVFDEPCPVPSEPGVHGWWFRSVPAPVAELAAAGCKQRDGLTLLYIGISPTPPPANGKPSISQDLRKRVRYHYGAGNGDAEGSTLRKTLGVLLADELGLKLRRIGSGERSTFAGGEAVLTEWMAENALVSWTVRQEPWLFENELIANLDLPFNIHGNQHNAFYPELKKLRRQAAVAAGKARILKEW